MAKRLAKSIAGGAWTQVRVDGVIIALAQGASYSEDFNAQPLETLGHLGPIEYESFGYSCEITIRWLVAKDKVDFNRIVPKRRDIQEDGMLEDHLVEFIDTATDAVHNAFKGCVISRNGETIESNQFITGDLALLSIERII